MEASWMSFFTCLADVPVSTILGAMAPLQTAETQPFLLDKLDSFCDCLPYELTTHWETVPYLLTEDTACGFAVLV